MKAKDLCSRALIWVSCAALIYIALAGGAQADPRCGDADAVLRDLAARFGERAIWEGATSDGLRLVVTANPDGSTWTALVLNDAAQACPVGAGSAWVPGRPIALGKEG